ncbi:MAG: phenylalanine--tRNA ligase subunit alpha [Spartobacteria bacterium]|nr:phenylalanine--tRNA ligase subunit alpha [Spartobacteria bacterium]
MKLQDVLNWRNDALEKASHVSGLKEIEEVRIKYLSRKGLIQSIMKGLKDIDPSERAQVGKLANEFKMELTAALDAKQATLNESASTKVVFDYTLPGNWQRVGNRHPISRIMERAIDIFRTLGFTVAEGPDIESVYHNFDALNTPATHPSRDVKDTFYLENGMLLRTQTSPVQIRYMESRKPPVRIVAPGRCYRRDTTDATHSANFHQMEGLYVDTRVSMSDLKGVISYFAQQMMGADVKVRFRPHFFPFTEPSVEFDFSCHVCGGKGCRVCKNSGWIEIAGAGMVDPEVFRAVGYNPDEVMGYAFGLGIERIAMILYGIPDIRLLYENDVRFLNQFQ